VPFPLSALAFKEPVSRGIMEVYQSDQSVSNHSIRCCIHHNVDNRRWINTKTGFTGGTIWLLYMLLMWLFLHISIDVIGSFCRSIADFRLHQISDIINHRKVLDDEWVAMRSLLMCQHSLIRGCLQITFW